MAEELKERVIALQEALRKDDRCVFVCVGLFGQIHFHILTVNTRLFIVEV